MEELDRRCCGGHTHVPLMEGRAAKAAIYPPKLCSSICKGLKAQIDYDAKMLLCSVRLNGSEIRASIGEMIADAVRMDDSQVVGLAKCDDNVRRLTSIYKSDDYVFGEYHIPDDDKSHKTIGSSVISPSATDDGRCAVHYQHAKGQLR